ncbi:MAG: Cu+-exporting ATPase [Gammaproteobacteria bacterium]|jgi:Cu+-exporting ATPase
MDRKAPRPPGSASVHNLSSIRALKAEPNANGAGNAQVTDKEPPAAELLDPVCGMTVTAQSEHHFLYEDTTHYFCSARCLGKFQETPARYLAGGVAPVEPVSNSGSVPYICPMHLDVRQLGPGACPKCGMALEPETPTLASKTQYTCPMHPEVVRDEPGACPKCGMALEAMTVSVEDEANPELVDMTRRLWISALLTVPLVIADRPPRHYRHGRSRGPVV